jgi:hypothetical protein
MHRLWHGDCPFEEIESRFWKLYFDDKEELVASLHNQIRSHPDLYASEANKP